MHWDPGIWIVLMGWPAVVVAGLTLALAIVRRSRWTAGLGCALLAPLFLYLTATPRFQWIAPLSFVLLCLLAWQIDRLRGVSIALLLLPAATLLLWLAIVVSLQ